MLYDMCCFPTIFFLNSITGLHKVEGEQRRQSDDTALEKTEINQSTELQACFPLKRYLQNKTARLC